MITMDVIVSWPRNNDYPLWRKFIHDYRSHFNNIIIVFTETFQGEDYRSFVRKAMFEDFVLCVDSPLPTGSEDWRNKAVNFGLLQSLHAPWIWFTEQDFFPNNEFFDILTRNEHTDYIGVLSGDRLHPCSLLIRRDVLKSITPDFSARPDDGYDHFGLIQRQLEAGKFRGAIIEEHNYQHYNGLSHNWTLIANGGEPNYKPEEFYEYILQCMDANVQMDERWLKVANRFISSKNTTPPPSINLSPKSPAS